MPKSPMQDFPEIFVSTSETATAVSRAVSQGELRQIGSKLYTRNLVDPPEQIVGRHLSPRLFAAGTEAKGLFD